VAVAVAMAVAAAVAVSLNCKVKWEQEQQWVMITKCMVWHAIIGWEKNQSSFLIWVLHSVVSPLRK